MSDERVLQDLWRSQTGVAAPPTEEALRTVAASFDRTIARRILFEQVAGASVAVGYLWYAATTERYLAWIAALLITAAAAYSLAHLRRRGAPGSPALAADGATFLREELVRQRDLRRSVRSWFLGPAVPGFGVFCLDLILHAASQGTGYAVATTGALALVASPFIVVDWGNRRKARQLQREIDELDAALAGR